MRIDRLRLRNFKKYEDFTLDLHPRFTLLVGENGSGKTTILDGLAVALGVWFDFPPDTSLIGGGRSIRMEEVRIQSAKEGDRTLFIQSKHPAYVESKGEIHGESVAWARRFNPLAASPNETAPSDVNRVIEDALESLALGRQTPIPIIASYGADRNCPSDPEQRETSERRLPSRWGAFRDCLSGRLRMKEISHWFRNEAIASVNRGGRFRPGFEVVRRAVLSCLPEAEAMWYDGDLDDLVLSIAGEAQPFANLSAGRRMMLAMVADIAIKAVTQNNFLVPPDALPEEEELPRVLAQTPGVVLIDELELHLHPRWQRRVVADLKRIFPAIQFVCTTHSPQIIGEVPPEEVRLLDGPAPGSAPPHALGLDSNTVLQLVMHAEAGPAASRAIIDKTEAAMDRFDLKAAREHLEELKDLQRGDTPDTAGLEAAINNLEALADADD